MHRLMITVVAALVACDGGKEAKSSSDRGAAASAKSANTSAKPEAAPMAAPAADAKADKPTGESSPATQPPRDGLIETPRLAPTGDKALVYYEDDSGGEDQSYALISAGAPQVATWGPGDGNAETAIASLGKVDDLRTWPVLSVLPVRLNNAVLDFADESEINFDKIDLTKIPAGERPVQVEYRGDSKEFVAKVPGVKTLFRATVDWKRTGEKPMPECGNAPSVFGAWGDKASGKLLVEYSYSEHNDACPGESQFELFDAPAELFVAIDKAPYAADAKRKAAVVDPVTK